MVSRWALIALVVLLLFASQESDPAHAKGSSYIAGATVSGGTLAAATTIPIRLPENLDDMFEIDAPPGVDGASLPYVLTLHYDFSEDGYGPRDWRGRYDGGSMLYFPDSMLVGPGTWASGWYEAVDVLAAALAGAAQGGGLAIAPAYGDADTQIDVSSNAFPPGAEVTFTVAFVSRLEETAAPYSQPIAIQHANDSGLNEVSVYLRDAVGVTVPREHGYARFRATTAGPSARTAEGVFVFTGAADGARALPSTGGGRSGGDARLFGVIVAAIGGIAMVAAGMRRRRHLLLLLALCTAACVGAACGDDAESPTVRSIATPSASARTGGDGGFRAFAAEIDQAVRARDSAFFRQRMKTERVDCSREPGANQLGGPLCETPDAVYDGFVHAVWKTDGGGMMPADNAAAAFDAMYAAQLPSAKDQYGGGEARVYALNVRDGSYKAVITSLMERPADFAGTGPLRSVISTSWAFDDGRWQMTSPLISAFVLSDDFLHPGTETGYDAWERYPTGSTVGTFPEMAVTFDYPALWTTGAQPMPYATCVTCTVVGPAGAVHPYGLQLWKGTREAGCSPPCDVFTANRLLPQSQPAQIDLNGHGAFREEFERQRPLGLVNEDGDITSYREILTVLPLAPTDGLPPEVEVPALFIDAFYRYGDSTGEAETRAALDLLSSTITIDSGD